MANLVIDDNPTIPLSGLCYLYGGADCRYSAASMWRILIADIRRVENNAMTEDEIRSTPYHKENIDDALRFLNGERDDITATAYHNILRDVVYFKRMKASCRRQERMMYGK